MTDKQITRLHNRIYYWRESPLWNSSTNPYFDSNISIIRTPEFESFYKQALMRCIIEDWAVKRIDEFKAKFEAVWASNDYLIMAENYYRKKANSYKMNWDDINLSFKTINI